MGICLFHEYIRIYRYTRTATLPTLAARVRRSVTEWRPREYNILLLSTMQYHNIIHYIFCIRVSYTVHKVVKASVLLTCVFFRNTFGTPF